MCLHVIACDCHNSPTSCISYDQTTLACVCVRATMCMYVGACTKWYEKVYMCRNNRNQIMTWHVKKLAHAMKTLTQIKSQIYATQALETKCTIFKIKWLNISHLEIQLTLHSKHIVFISITHLSTVYSLDSNTQLIITCSLDINTQLIITCSYSS